SPIEECRRSKLYQLTQEATAASTWRQDVQEVRSKSMTSVLNSPMVDSITALSSASPTVPMDPMMPALWSSSVKATDRYWLPASEWWTSPWEVKVASVRLRMNSAWLSAEVTSSVFIDVHTRQPRIRRENTSVTNET